MKPVIITLNSDNKVVMSVEDFKRHMDAAYNQGYADGQYATASLSTQPYLNNNKRWWTDITYSDSNNAAINKAYLSDTATADACDCVAGSCNCSTSCENQASISDYIRNKGE